MAAADEHKCVHAVCVFDLPTCSDGWFCVCLFVCVCVCGEGVLYECGWLDFDKTKHTKNITTSGEVCVFANLLRGLVTNKWPVEKPFWNVSLRLFVC